MLLTFALKIISAPLQPEDEEPQPGSNDTTDGSEQEVSGNSFDCTSPGIFASPYDCNSYFQCSAEGTSYEHKCPAGLNFNSQAKICDWPANVACSSQTKSIVVNQCSNKMDGTYYDPNDCTKIVTCRSYQMYQSSCPPGLYFDPAFGSCHQFAFYRYRYQA